jgi:hypothetical protein
MDPPVRLLGSRKSMLEWPSIISLRVINRALRGVQGVAMPHI